MSSHVRMLMMAFVCLAFPCGPVLGAQGDANFVGTWSSVRVFGPAMRSSTIVLQRQHNAWITTIGDARARTGVSAAATLSFPGEGDLRVDRKGEDITVHWIQPATVTTGYRFATPIHLIKVKDDTWRGQIEPIADVAHFWMFVERTADGDVSVFFRNPEANAGARIGIRRLEIDGTRVALKKLGSPDLIGSFDSQAATISFQFSEYPGVFVFRKDERAQRQLALLSDRAPAANGDGWTTATPAQVGLQTSAIAQLIDRLSAPAASPASPFIQSLQIARHGKLVVDAYFNGFSVDRPHDVRSAGKSITTLMLGRAIEDNYTITPQSRVYTLYAQYAPFTNDDPRKAEMTLADLMTMRSGYACDDNDDNSPGNEDRMQSQIAQPDWYKYTLDLPLVTAPGSHAVYCSAGINLLGGVISQASSAWLPDAFWTMFGQPMQFGQYGLWLTSAPLDTAYMAGGDYFLPRDFLKFGELFLRSGRWNGRQIVDNAWLVASAQPRASLYAPGDYGYGWHLYTYSIAGRTVKAISAGGNGGQLLLIFPTLDMTVMITAANYGQYPVWQKFLTDLVPKDILPAVEDAQR